MEMYHELVLSSNTYQTYQLIFVCKNLLPRPFSHKAQCTYPTNQAAGRHPYIYRSNSSLGFQRCSSLVT